MRTWIGVISMAMLLCHPSAAAEEPAPAQNHPPPAGTGQARSMSSTGAWSLGTGFELAAGQSEGTDLFTLMMLGSMGSYALLYSSLLSEPRPRLVLLVEYQLLESLAVVMQARGNFTYLQNDGFGAGSMLLPDARFDWSAGASLGCRFIVNPRGVVELSVLGVPYVDYVGRQVVLKVNSGAPSDPTTTLTFHTLSGGLMVGLAVEKQLLPNLVLRLQTSLLDLNGRWGVLEMSSTISPSPYLGADQPSQVRLGIDLKIAPALELRLRF